MSECILLIRLFIFVSHWSFLPLCLGCFGFIMHSFSRLALSIAISVVAYNKQLKSVKSSTQKSKFVMTSFTSFMLSSNFFIFGLGGFWNLLRRLKWIILASSNFTLIVRKISSPWLLISVLLCSFDS